MRQEASNHGITQQMHMRREPVMPAKISSDRKTTRARIKACSEIDPGTGCWNWIMSLQRNGYGQIKHDGKMKRAHRVSYEAFNGEIFTDLEVMHTCDNRRCVNPLHLKAGTHSENMAEMKARGAKRGEDHHCFGVPRPPELFAAQCKPVSTDGRNYPSIKMAERDLGLSHGAIRYRLKVGKAYYLGGDHTS
jgi:hypothetical protein